MIVRVALAGAMACLLSLAPALAKEPCAAGSYEGHAMEIAVAITLHGDGRYNYALVYGALDEQSHGRWRLEDGRVHLVSDPYVEPRFVFLGETQAPDGTFRFLLDLPQGMERAYFDVEVQREDGALELRQFGHDGLVLTPLAGERPVAVRLLFGLMAIASEPRALRNTKGAELRFRFEPNDIGMVRFADEALPLTGEDLEFERHGRHLRLHKVQPGCLPGR